ncbi:MAG: glycine C-acetyltransferase [Myxococcota bacterium]|nr:glycine C-acetyltransferase [Myxococcota bacterium]
MFESAKEIYQELLSDIEDAGLTKNERVITSPQGADINAKPGGEVINFCANNYLGLSSHPDVIEAARTTMQDYGFGLSSVRFICGTQLIHKELEEAVARFLGTEDTILYSSCFDANAGLFETILTKEDAIISDSLNHASIIDGIRLCKAERHRYPNGDMDKLEEALKATQARRLRLIATDGVFSMDGCYAKLEQICDLADKYNAMVMIDDSHATGFVGRTGRGTAELCDVAGRVDIITSTLGKALGGASGGFTTGRKEIIDLLRQRSRPYLFSNTLAPAICGASLKVLSMLEASTHWRDKLESNTNYFRSEMSKLGFDILPGTHPIVPVMFGDARKATEAADKLLEEGIYVIGFSYPVVPKGQARIRVQISAAHEQEHLEKVVAAFAKVREELS